jgi:dUTP pyrophosphatase
MQVKFKKLHEDATIPMRMSPQSGAWDVTATEIIVEEPGYVICNLGFSLAPPPNYRVVLVPRSNITKYGWVLANSIGVGDADYRGEYQFRFRALPKWGVKIDGVSVEYTLSMPEFPYKKGDRVGQLWVEEVQPINFVEVVSLDTTDRGVGGFGSTGL